MADVVHIFSLLLRADPGQLDVVLENIRALEGVDPPIADDSGKIIVTLETESESEIVNYLKQLSLVDGVVSTSLVYHQAENLTDATG